MFGSCIFELSYSSAIPLMNESLRKTSLRLCINDAQHYYISGDIVRGKLILDVVGPQIHTGKVLIDVRAIEVTTLKSGESHKTLLTPEEMSPLVIDVDVSRVGLNIIPFEYVLPEECCRSSPPSTTFEDVGDKVSRITWYLEAKLEHNQSSTELSVLKASADIQVCSKVSAERLVELRKRLPKITRGREDIKLVADLPRSIGPTIYNINLKIIPGRPVLIEYVKFSLRKTVVKWLGMKSEVLEATQDLGCIDYGQYVTTQLFVDVAAKKWRMNQAPCISSVSIHTRYELVVSVSYQKEGALLCQAEDFFDTIDFLPPSVYRSEPGVDLARNGLPSYFEHKELSNNKAGKSHHQ